MKRNKNGHESISKKDLSNNRRTSLFTKTLPRLALEMATGGNESSIIVVPSPEPPPPIRG